MNDSLLRAGMREILNANGSFEEPELWIDYALKHNFRRVASQRVPACPDCGAPPESFFAQYVYYSNRIRLVACRRCSLIWADRRLAPEVLQQHFEHAYKDETYFVQAREAVFVDLARTVARLAPSGASVLDYGGAKGHLLKVLRALRPDLDLTLSDLSSDACRYVAENLGIRAVQGGIDVLNSRGTREDVLILSDVMYYEPHLHALWEAIRATLAPGGTLVLRLPNKSPIIRIAQWLRALRRQTRTQTSIRFFNPEHIYILTPKYLRARLRSLGFDSVKFAPTPPTTAGAARRLVPLWLAFARAVATLTRGRVIPTSAMIVIARRSKGLP